MSDDSRRRFSPEQRKALILAAAHRVLSRDGLPGFSLDAIAREAGVANSLPRHYFNGHDGLLTAVAMEVLEKVLGAFSDPDPSGSLEGRLNSYLDVINASPWAHALWMGGYPLDAHSHDLLKQARIAVIEAASGRPLGKLSKREQVHASGLLGYVERIVTDWIANGMRDRKLVIEVLAAGVRVLQEETGKNPVSARSKVAL